MTRSLVRVQLAGREARGSSVGRARKPEHHNMLCVFNHPGSAGDGELALTEHRKGSSPFPGTVDEGEESSLRAVNAFKRVRVPPSTPTGCSPRWEGVRFGSGRSSVRFRPPGRKPHTSAAETLASRSPAPKGGPPGRRLVLHTDRDEFNSRAFHNGRLAHLGERRVRNAEAAGSSPASSTPRAASSFRRAPRWHRGGARGRAAAVHEMRVAIGDQAGLQIPPAVFESRATRRAVSGGSNPSAATTAACRNAKTGGPPGWRVAGAAAGFEHPRDHGRWFDSTAIRFGE